MFIKKNAKHQIEKMISRKVVNKELIKILVIIVNVNKGISEGTEGIGSTPQGD